MSRLWPERLTAAVFRDMCRLYRAGGSQVAQLLSTPSDDFNVGDRLMLLLDEHPVDRHATLDVIVSDGVARSIPLPWQESLDNDTQREAYARACFNQAGYELEQDWLVQASYRHFRGIGLGYALPRSLVLDVRDRMRERGIHLRSIMPLSAHAYWRNGKGMQRKRTILLLREQRRLSAMLFEQKTCTGIHVQPIGGNLADGVRRLLGSVDAVFPAVSQVQLWSSGSAPDEVEIIRGRFPEATIDVLSGLGWS